MKKDDEYKITRTFSIQIKLWKRFKDMLALEHLGVSEVLSMLIEKWLEKEVAK